MKGEVKARKCSPFTIGQPHDKENVPSHVQKVLPTFILDTLDRKRVKKVVKIPRAGSTANRRSKSSLRKASKSRKAPSKRSDGGVKLRVPASTRHKTVSKVTLRRARSVLHK